MADAWGDKIAAAVAAELNNSGRPWATRFSTEVCIAERTRKPWYKNDDLKFLKCAVVPGTIKRTRQARPRCVTGRKFEYQVLIDLQKMVEPDDDTQLKALSYMAETIQDWFDDGHALTGLAGWICLEADRPEDYYATALRVDRTWETMIDLTVEGSRQ